MQEDTKAGIIVIGVGNHAQTIATTLAQSMPSAHIVISCQTENLPKEEIKEFQIKALPQLPTIKLTRIRYEPFYKYFDKKKKKCKTQHKRSKS